MIIKSKQSQVREIQQYIMANTDKYSECIIFGKCTTKEGTSDDYLNIALKTVDDDVADDYDALLDVYTEIDNITNGKFNLVILNSVNAPDINNEIEKGVLLYG